MIEPFFFGSSRELFGLYQPPRRSAVSPRTVVVCPPFGDEALRAHYACNAAALLLAERGCGVLRFDYYGTGDSAGNGDEVSLKRWRADVRAALAEAKERGGRARTVLFGIRLGAALAVQVAAEQADEGAAEGLVLWSPVTNGADYVEELCEQQREWQRGSWDSRSNGGSEDEVLGFCFPPALRAELAEMRLPAPGVDRVLEICAGEARVERMGAPRGTSFDAVEEGAADVWRGGSNVQRGLAVHRVLKAIARWVPGEAA